MNLDDIASLDALEQPPARPLRRLDSHPTLPERSVETGGVVVTVGRQGK
jgi:hypothetical protein